MIGWYILRVHCFLIGRLEAGNWKMVSCFLIGWWPEIITGRRLAGTCQGRYDLLTLGRAWRSWACVFRFGDKSFMKSASKIGSLLESWFTANISVFSSSVSLVNIV